MQIMSEKSLDEANQRVINELKSKEKQTQKKTHNKNADDIQSSTVYAYVNVT